MEDVLLWAKKLMKLGITMLSMAMPVVPAYGVSAAANTEGVALKGKYEEKYFFVHFRNDIVCLPDKCIYNRRCVYYRDRND